MTVRAKGMPADGGRGNLWGTSRGWQMVRIGTWNLENLFRPGDEGGPSSDGAYRAKLDALATTITDIEPDVLAVQEVGNPDALADLAERAGGGWVSRTAPVAPDERPIRVGYLSRLPLTGVEPVAAFPPGLMPVQVNDDGPPVSGMGRAALRARVEVAGQPIDLVTCHLKSKLLSYPPGPSGRPRFDARDEGERARFGVYALSRRAAEAATVRAEATRLLGDQGRDRAVIVLGDLNDVPDAATTQILYGPPGSEIGTAGFADTDKGELQRLWNLAGYIPAAQRFSRRYRGRDELIDHILVSHLVVTRVRDGQVRTDGTGPMPSVDDDPRSRRDAPGSDHRPVVARIDL